MGYVSAEVSSLGEDDLAAGRHVVELADGDDVLDLGDEVVLLDAEQVDRRLAGVAFRIPMSPIISMNSGRPGMSFCSILRPIMCVAIADMPGRPPSMVAMCMPGLPTVDDLDVLEPLGVDGVKPEEGEEEVRLDPLGPGAVGHDQAWVDRPRVNPWR